MQHLCDIIWSRERLRDLEFKVLTVLMIRDERGREREFETGGWSTTVKKTHNYIIVHLFFALSPTSALGMSTGIGKL